jgi:hypothetical protein
MSSSSSIRQRPPFVDGKPIPYRAAWSTEQFARISAGHISHAMEDKWNVYYEAPHLLFHRSWTDRPVYRVTIASGPQGNEVSEALVAIDFTTKPGYDPLYEAKLLDFLISILLLRESKPFPLPPNYKQQGPPGLLQHTVAGTAYKEVPHQPLPQPRKPWWQFW